MAFREVVEKIKSANDHGFPEGASRRYKRLDAFDRMLKSTLYEHIPYSFDQEKSGNKYIKLRERRPSIIYNLAKVVVDQHAALTFGEAHFPHVRCLPQVGQDEADEKQKKTEQACASLCRELKLPAIMQNALGRGSIGSVVLVAKILDDDTAKIDVVSGKLAKPTLNIKNPYKLDNLERIWPVAGDTLLDYGYDVDKDDVDKTFWLRVSVSKLECTWFLPLKSEDYAKLGDTDNDGKKIEWRKDEKRSGTHGFDEIPAVWIRNLLVGDDAIDGPCTFSEIADICVALDYELSQIDRGLRYSMDPLLVIKTGELGQAAIDLATTSEAQGEGGLVKSAAQALPLEGSDADAKLLETNGKGFEGGREFIRAIREYALEVAGGMKSDSERGSGSPQSGRALELLYQTVVWHVERLRVAYGDNGLLPLLRILLRALRDGKIDLKDGNDWTDIDPDAPLSLVWPKWWVPRGSDLFQEMQGIGLAAGSTEKSPIALISPDLATRLIAQTLDVDDVNAVAKEAEQLRKENEAKRAAESEQQHANAVALTKVKREGGSGANSA